MLDERGILWNIRLAVHMVFIGRSHTVLAWTSPATQGILPVMQMPTNL